MRPERALLSGMVDYAGLFPPAQLPLEKAVREYAVHLGGAEAWMLGRFIIPAQRLEELEPYLVIFWKRSVSLHWAKAVALKTSI